MGEIGIKQPTLSEFKLSENVTIRWKAMSPDMRTTMVENFRILQAKSILNDDIADIVLKNCYYASGLTQYLSLLSDLHLPYSQHLDAIAAQAFISVKMKLIFEKLTTAGYAINEHRFRMLLTVRDVDSWHYSIGLLLSSQLFTESRVDHLLGQPNLPVLPYIDCLKLFLKHFMLTDSNEDLLKTVEAKHLNNISLSLSVLDTVHCFSSELFRELVVNQEQSEAISDGLKILESRVDAITSGQVKTVISAGNEAVSVATCLSALARVGLDSDAHCARLLSLKNYAPAVATMLYQLQSSELLKQEGYLTQVFAVAHWLMEPVIRRELNLIPFFQPLSAPRISALLSSLSLIPTDSTNKDELLKESAKIISSDRTGDISPPEKLSTLTL